MLNPCFQQLFVTLKNKNGNIVEIIRTVLGSVILIFARFIIQFKSSGELYVYNTWDHW